MMDYVDYMGEYSDPGGGSNWWLLILFGLLILGVHLFYKKYVR